jgi:hypothetical protein
MAEYGPNPALLPLIKDAALAGYKSKKSLKGSELWQSKPCLIMVVRRPGCSMCRAQAKELADMRPRLSEMGINLVAVSHQDDSVDDFLSGYFGISSGQEDALYLDPTKAFYKAVGGGQERTKGLLGIFSTKVWENNRAAGRLGTSGNLSGDYSRMGGLLLLGKGDAGVQWYFQEVEFGDRAPTAAILKACESLKK